VRGDEFEDDPAAQAFHELRAEVTVTRKDVAALHDQIEANRPPDYGVDLAEMKQVIAVLAKQIEVLSRRPGLESPEEHGQRITLAGRAVTQEAVRALEEAQRGFERQKAELAQWVAVARVAQVQARWIYAMGAVVFVCGMAASWLLLNG